LSSGWQIAALMSCQTFANFEQGSIINSKEMFMIRIAYISAVVLLASSAVAQAQTSAVPITQGAASVNKNLSKDPDNKGLQNASRQLQENQVKQAEKRTEQEKKQEMKKEAHTERNEVRHEKVEHPAKIEHPARIEHPAKIEHPGK
jgi:hypothetical protein